MLLLHCMQTRRAISIDHVLDILLALPRPDNEDLRKQFSVMSCLMRVSLVQGDGDEEVAKQLKSYYEDLKNASGIAGSKFSILRSLKLTGTTLIGKAVALISEYEAANLSVSRASRLTANIDKFCRCEGTTVVLTDEKLWISTWTEAVQASLCM